jgi:hypothetical protein
LRLGGVAAVDSRLLGVEFLSREKIGPRHNSKSSSPQRHANPERLSACVTRQPKSHDSGNSPNQHGAVKTP